MVQLRALPQTGVLVLVFTPDRSSYGGPRQVVYLTALGKCVLNYGFDGVGRGPDEIRSSVIVEGTL